MFKHNFSLRAPLGLLLLSTTKLLHSLLQRIRLQFQTIEALCDLRLHLTVLLAHVSDVTRQELKCLQLRLLLHVVSPSFLLLASLHVVSRLIGGFFLVRFLDHVDRLLLQRGLRGGDTFFSLLFQHFLLQFAVTLLGEAVDGGAATYSGLHRGVRHC